MAADWMSHHLLISISDPHGGEKVSNEKTLQILKKKFYTILSHKDIFMFFLSSL